jgi:hypothetical protein
MTTQQIEKFARVAKELSESSFDLALLALLQRARANGKWDVVVAAPRADETLETYRYVATRLKSVLDTDGHGLALPNRPAASGEQAVHDIVDATASTRGKLLPFILNGMGIRQGYIFHRSLAS